MSYTLPQVQVFQEVTQVPTAVVANLNPFVYGANYSLRRYSEASEKALIGIGAYDPAAGNDADYPNLAAGSVVDESYVKVYADDAWLKYANLPNSATNPVYCVSTDERNKLRAAPRIVDGGEYNDVAGTAVTINPKGFHVGAVALPEAYYIFFQDTFTLGTGAGVAEYITSEGLTGTFDVPADATAAGVRTQGPDGLVLDFDGPGVVAHMIRTVTFMDAAGTSYFTMSFADEIAACNNNIDTANDHTIQHISGVLVPPTYINKALVITALVATTTLAALRAAIVAVGAITADFTVSAITGTGTLELGAIEDQLGNSLTIATTQMIPHVFRTYVYENNWVFKTANDVSRTGTLYKDVEVGDKVFWSVTPASTGIEETGWSTVAGLEADYSRATVGAATVDADNQATVAANDLTAGVAVMTANDDNAKNTGSNMDFSVANTKVYSLSVLGAGSITNPIQSLSAGVLEDSYTLTVTKGGVKGVAELSVANTSGTYSRTGVLVESSGAAEGRAYIGNNMYVDFTKGSGLGADGTFVVGDIYYIGAVTSLKTGFTAVTGQVSSGTYVGTVDDTYHIEVTRGGLFVAANTVLKGITVTAGTTLTASLAGWTAGDVDDEYVLECTTAGTIATALFSLTSNRGDNASSVAFAAAAAAVTVGASGLALTFSTDVSFTLGSYWVIVVRASRPKLRITDSAGVDQESSVVAAHDGLVTVGLNGAEITFPTNTNTLGLAGTYGGLMLGDVFDIACTASAPGAIQTLVLADELPDTVACGMESEDVYNYEPDRFEVDLCLVKASKSIPAENEDPLVTAGGYNWTAGTEQVALIAGITLQDSTWVDPMGDMPFLPLVSGDLYVEYRSLLQDYADAIYSISDITQCVTTLGPNVSDNPLSLAVYCALENIGRGSVYFTAIPTDDAAGDTAALAKAGLVSNIYAFNPAGVTDPARHALLEAHIASLSTEIKKRWRIGLVGRDLPATEEILTADTNPSHIDWKATVSGTGNKKVTLTQDGSLVANMEVGDEVRLQFATDAWGRVTYTTDYVASISSNTVFYLETGLAAPVPVANKLEVYHARSSAEIATAVKAISEGYGNKRIYHCFPGNLGRYGTYVNAAYGAASVSGIVGSVVPQQGLTNIEVNGYDDIPYAYGMFSYDELNTMAEGGTLIVMQDIKEGQVYVRHQISTAYKDGNLNTTEMSMVKNLDSISYYFADLLRPFIGRYNVTPQLISVLRTQIQDGLNYLGSLTSVGLLGPQVILSEGNTKIRTLEQHPSLKDRVVAIVDIQLPPPLNVIELHIVV